MPTTPGPFYFTGNVMDGGALTPVGAAPVAPPPPPVAAPAPPAGAAPGGAPVPPPAAAPVAAAPVATGKSVGRLHVWGYAFDPARQGPSGSVAQATLELTGRGQILLGGTLVAGRVAILAGTGEFRGANGQAEYVDLGNGGARVILDYTTPYEGT